MKRKTYSQILDDIVRDQVPQSLDLVPQTMRRIQSANRITMQSRMKIFATLMLVLVMLAVVLTQVPAVTAAFQRWIGYIPGFGLVSEGQIRVLAESVSVTRDEVTITVREGMLDAERAKLTYDVHGIPDTAFKTSLLEDGCIESGQLRLPDGTLLRSNEGEVLSSSNYQRYEYDYPAIPAAVDEAVLEIPCLHNTYAGVAPENWEIPLRFVPAPSDLEVLPVVEISTPTAVATAPAPLTEPVSEADGIFLTLDRVVPLADGDLIYVTVHWGGTDFVDLERFEVYKTLHLLDGDGEVIKFEFDEDESFNHPIEHQTTLAIKTLHDYNPEKLTLILDAALVSLPIDASFVFDPGPDPQPGQTWELNQEITFGEHTLLVRSVTAETDCNCYSFLISSADIFRVSLNDLAHMGSQYAIFGEAGFGGGEFTAGVRYAGEDLPEGPLTLGIFGITVLYNGPWQVQWVP